MITFPVPDLDGDDISPDDYQELLYVFMRLANFCAHKREAADWKAKGKDEDAARCNRLADGDYKALPEWAQWRRGE